MLQKLQHSQDRGPDGSPFNEAPPNWREVSQEELVASRRLIWSAHAIEFRQILRVNGQKIDGPVISAHLHWVHGLSGEGWAWAEDWTNRRMRFFLFEMCEHELEVTGRPYNCYTEYKCKKCGWETAVDSSD